MENREIKFRAWDKGGQKMLNNCFELTEAEIIQWVQLKQAIKVIWMQFTGLKDKNGKEIYEGDVITRLIEPTLGRNYIETVVIEWGIYQDDEYGNHRSGFDISEHSELFKIIGNIYQNPELVKQ